MKTVFNELYNLSWKQVELACEKTNYMYMLKDILKHAKRQSKRYNIDIHLTKRRIIAVIAEGYKLGSGHTEEGSTTSKILGTTLGAWLKDRNIKWDIP